MYNIMYFYVFQCHTKLCLSLWKPVTIEKRFKEEGVMTKIDNHTVRIFPDVCHDILSNLMSSCWGCNLEKNKNKTPQQAACTHTHTNDSTDLDIMTDRVCRGKHNFPYDKCENTHIHTHTRYTHMLDGKSTKTAHCASRIVLKYVTAVTVHCTVFW